MSTREALIVLAHAQWCEPCRQRLLTDPAATLRGRALTSEEKESLAGLTEGDFYTLERLALAAGSSVEELGGYRDHPVVRLRHL
jgi:hypothetical protein